MSEFFGEKGQDSERAERLHQIIDRLAAGESASSVKKEFHALIKGSDAVEVAALEQSLIENGMPVEEVQRLCEVHAEVFRAGLEKGVKAERMSGHPVHTYMAENREARRRSTRLFLWSFRNAERIREAAEDLRAVIVHYERKENQLFPFLERTGFTGPSKVMWGKHDEIRAAFRELDDAVERMDSLSAGRIARSLVKKIKMMIFMEERILFPNSLKRLSEADWVSVRRGEDAIGFAWVRPGSEWDPALPELVRSGAPDYGGARSGTAGGVPEPGVYVPAGTDEGSPAVSAMTDIPLSTGSLPLDWLNRILTVLPCDISFVDADNKVRYYSDSPHRVFPRSPGIIGRDVANCHPPKSVHIVEKIIEAFRNKEKDAADFWIEMNGRFIFISYKPLYDDSGAYLGTLEMSMDATSLRSLEGQRRLLDW